MDYTLEILRKKRNSNESIWERFNYHTESDTDTIASALTALNAQEELFNTEGHPSRKIEWECSCLQKKCGACAMVINGKPRLACDARIKEFKGVIRLEPLRKFPVICDLVVDRSILYDNLKTLKLWLKESAELADEDQDLAYRSSECIQCGCCLEICPNFYVGGKFFGMSTVPITTRLLTEMPVADYKEIAKLYARHTFAGCGKSLACRDVCPKHIDTQELLVNANALAVWKRKRKNTKKM